MKSRLIIVGAGGFGREVLQWANDAVADGVDWHLGGFLDDNPHALDAFDCEQTVLDRPDAYEPTRGDVLLCAMGDPAVRRTVVDDLSSRGAQFATLIHPTAIVGARVALGEGTIICPRVTITTDATIGRHVILNVLTSVGHDATIGDFGSLFCHVDVTGNVTLGKSVTVGSNASILPGVSVGDFALVGAGSVVTRRVKPYVTVFGNPAKKIFDNTPVANDAA